MPLWSETAKSHRLRCLRIRSTISEHEAGAAGAGESMSWAAARSLPPHALGVKMTAVTQTPSNELPVADAAGTRDFCRIALALGRCVQQKAYVYEVPVGDAPVTRYFCSIVQLGRSCWGYQHQALRYK